MNLSAESIALNLDKGRRIRAGEYQACCPAHHDASPSLSLTQNGDTVLWYCHAGCSQMTVRDALASRGLLPKPKAPRPAKAATLYDEVEMKAFIHAYEAARMKNVPTSTKAQCLYRQFQRSICSPFTPGELMEAHMFCLAYRSALGRGERPSQDEDAWFRICSEIHYAIGGYVPYEY